MKLMKISLEQLLGELSELPSDWVDDAARDLIQCIHRSVQRLRRLKRIPTQEDLEEAFESEPAFLDVCRLFLDKGQESVAHMICDILGGRRMGWQRLRRLASEDSDRIAKVMVELGIPEIIQQGILRKWRVEDVLIERYKMSRGRAIAGQRRGRDLEDEVESILQKTKVPFERGVTFVGKKGERAKCDFAIPAKEHPNIVMETKGFEATGSKLTDFLGDVLKIGQAKDYHMYFFVITDGRGWFHRQSDLKKLVKYHDEGLVDMIYTRARLKQLAKVVKHIYQNE
jgi:hypothetical protein